MQRSKELMWAALHACGFGLPRLLKHSGTRPFKSHLHCSSLLSCLFSMPESDSAEEKSSASISPMEFSPVCTALLPEKVVASGQLEGTIHVCLIFSIFLFYVFHE